jgi:purine-binding chemotaxis protein CheW
MEQNQIEQKQNKELQEKFIVLQIENENFVIPLEYVSEIVMVQNVTEAPHQPDWVKGIMNLRNSVISLIDTRKRLGLKSTMGLVTKDIAVIIEYKGYHFAMLADDITKMKAFKPDSRQKGSLTDNPFVLGIFDDDEGLYQELDLNGILSGKNEELFVDLNKQSEQPK